MPNLVKIGQTTQSIEKRVNALKSTGVPTPFELFFCVMVRDPKSCERALHLAFSAHRNSKDREFFIGSAPELLNQALSHLIPYLANDVGEQEEGICAQTHGTLSEKETQLLISLAYVRRTVGLTTRELSSSDEWFRGPTADDLEVESAAATLTRLKLVRELKGRRAFEESRWAITAEGIKYLDDHALLPKLSALPE
jgi:hypothetical protein